MRDFGLWFGRYFVNDSSLMIDDPYLPKSANDRTVDFVKGEGWNNEE
jgi:hypothetical protein